MTEPTDNGGSPRFLGPAEADIHRPRPGPRYNPEPRRENVRGLLAAGSFLLFAISVLGVMWVVATGRRTWDEMQGVSAALIPTITSVVASTIGFYFGTRGREDGQ